MTMMIKPYENVTLHLMVMILMSTMCHVAPIFCFATYIYFYMNCVVKICSINKHVPWLNLVVGREGSQ